LTVTLTVESVQIRCERLERLLLRQQLLEIHRGDLAVHAEEGRARRIDEVQADQAIAVREREPAQHHSVDHAEHRRHAGDSKREDDDGEGAETFVLDQDAEADPDVAEQGVCKHSAPSV
jgi:hypothetical protein